MHLRLLSKLAFSVLFLLCIPFSLKAQWYLQPPGGPPVQSVVIDFVSRDVGYTGGQIGVFKTIDGAQTWSQVSLGTTYLDNGLWCGMQFQNSLQGCITGITTSYGATIIMTHDGGATWSEFVFGTWQEAGEDVDFPTNQTGYVVATAGYMEKTTNNGFSWQSISSGTSADLYAVDFVTPNYGYIGGTGTLKRTTNGGASWTNVSGPWTEIGQIQFLDSLTGYVLDDGQIYKTLDAGTTWNRITYNMGMLINMYFLTPSVGYCMNQIYLGVHKTIDGGGYWSSQTADSTGYLQLCMTFGDDTTGYIGGMGQDIQKTTNGGGASFFPYNDAGVDTIPTVACSGTQPIVVDLKNFGVDTLYTTQIDWSVDGIPQSPYSWSGLLVPAAIQQVTLGVMNFPVGTHTISAFTGSPNTVNDDRPVNDSATIVFTTGNCTFNDPGVSAALSPTAFLASPGINPINVTVKNYGINTLNSFTIQWELNGVPQANYVWTGNLLPGTTSSSLLLGSGNFVAGSNLVKAWTTNPNSSSDIYNSNDTLYYAVYSCNGPMNGTYQVCGANRDFNSIIESVTALTTCGVNGPVTINVDSGYYFGKVTITAIPGASPVNQITIQALNGDSSSVVLSSFYGSIIQDQWNYTLRLSGCSYINLKSLTFTTSDTSWYSLVQIWSAANHNTISHCMFLGIDDSSLVGYSGTLIREEVSTSYSETYNVIDHNYFTRGTTAIRLDGTSSQHESGNHILYNRIEVMFRGIDVSRQQDCNVKYNTILIAATDTVTSVNPLLWACGILISNPYDSVEVCRNSIRMLGEGKNIGIALHTTHDTLPLLISNNFVRVTCGSAEKAFAFQCSTSVVRLYNNSLVITGPLNSSNAVIWMYSSNAQFQPLIKNNIICTHAGGYALQCMQANLSVISDHNDYFPLKNYYAGTIYYGLSFWQGIGLDPNGLEIIPPFISMSDLHLQSWNSQLDGVGAPFAEIPDDIDGDARNVLTPDIGADEYLPSVILGAETFEESFVKIYPNPATDRLTISGLKNSDWEITDINGRIVMSGKLIEQDTEINVENLVPGMYIVNVTDEYGIRVTRKLVVN